MILKCNQDTTGHQRKLYPLDYSDKKKIPRLQTKDYQYFASLIYTTILNKFLKDDEANEVICKTYIDNK